LGKSFSKKAKYSLAPAEPSPASAETSWVAAAGAEARAGSVASNLESSAERSEGKDGAWGEAGAVYDLTTPTWASLACREEGSQRVSSQIRLHLADDQETNLGDGLVAPELVQVQVLNQV